MSISTWCLSRPLFHIAWLVYNNINNNNNNNNE